MKKWHKILLCTIGTLAVLWVAVFVLQESYHADLRKDQFILIQPQAQGLYRLRPVKDEPAADTPEPPVIYLKYYEDEIGHGLPKGWQPPGTVELVSVIGNTHSSMRFDEPPYAGNYVRIVLVTAPELRRVTCKAYFLGIFPAKEYRTGYWLLESGRAATKAYHEGEPDQVNLVKWVDGSEIKNLQYLDARWYDDLGDVELSQLLSKHTAPLSAETDSKQIAKIPSKIYFVN